MSAVLPVSSVAESAAPVRHPRWTIRIHWLSALLIVAAFASVWVRELAEGDALRAQILGLHRQIGVLVLTLWVLRLVVRLLTPPAHLSAGWPWWLRWAATGSHVVLYAILLAMPLLGWATTTAQGHPLLWLNALPLPALVAVDPDLADSLQEWHERCGWALLALVGAHLGAALWHHLIRRDGVLAAMVPWLHPRAPKV